MTRIVFGAILSAVGLNALAQIFLRKAMLSVNSETLALGQFFFAVATEPWLIGGLVCYAASLVLWLFVLSHVEVSVAYPFLSIGYVIAAVIGFLFLSENLTASRVFGIALICSGLFFISRSA
jgi:multidrug transporter EmrE-like cation transporter